MKIYDLAIAGGGASGLFAACAAARAKLSVLVLEASDRVGKKLLSTGNGQGNVAPAQLSPRRYHGGDSEFPVSALSAFPVEATRRAFEELGLLTIEEDGKIFPLSKQAGSVVDVLRTAAASLGVSVKTETALAGAKRLPDESFELSCQTAEGTEKFFAKHLLLATGGKAAPTSKRFADGYAIARAFGHRLTELSPSLVQLKGDVSDIRVLKGVKTDVRLTLSDGKRTYFSEIGEILFCDYGISGKIVFEGSSRVAGENFAKLYAHVDFLPQYSDGEVLALLFDRRKQFADLPSDQLLLGSVKSQIARAALAKAGIVRGVCADYGDGALEEIAKRLKDFPIKLTCPHSFELAQVTHGGIDTADVFPETMMSKRVPGLFFSGEILDVDGDCGGFNLQWCWSSAAAAVREICSRERQV